MIPTGFRSGWSGQDDSGGVGIGSYELYVSENGQPFQLLFPELDTTAMEFLGREGYSYAFYTRASDLVGNREPGKLSAEASTLVERSDLAYNDIPLQEGWNLISSYLDPDSSDMLTLLKPAGNDIILLKDGAGKAVIPEYAINDVGEWEITQGYQLKSRIDTFLPIVGSRIDPSETPIPIEEGWQIIPYLRTTPGNIELDLAEIVDSNCRSKEQ